MDINKIEKLLLSHNSDDNRLGAELLCLHCFYDLNKIKVTLEVIQKSRGKIWYNTDNFVRQNIKVKDIEFFFGYSTLAVCNVHKWKRVIDLKK